MPKLRKDLSPQELISFFGDALRQTAINPTIAGYQAQEHQIAFHSSPKNGRLFIGGNRSGKTVGGAAEAVMWLTGDHRYQEIEFEPPVRGRIVAVDFDNGVELIVKPEIKRWIPPSSLINGSWEDSFNKSLRQLTLANGSTVEFMSYDQDVDKFAGTSRHFVWFDEEPPEPIFNECLLRLVDVNGRWWCTMTPLIDMSWTYDRLYEPWKTKKSNIIDVFEVSTLQNKYIKEEALNLLTDGIDEGEKAARMHGTYISYTGLVYKEAFSQDNVIEDVIDSRYWEEIRTQWGHFVMMDHGYTNPTVFLFGAFDQDGRIIIYDEIYQTGKLVHQNAQDVLERIESLKIRPEYIVGDPSIRNSDPISGSSVHTAYAENNVFITLGNNDVSAGIERVASRFRKKLLFITNRCEKTLWEINRYRWEKYASAKIAQRKNPKETPVKKNDHAMDALRYGVVSRPVLPGEEEISAWNFLGAPGVATDFDMSLTAPEQEVRVFDEILGTEW